MTLPIQFKIATGVIHSIKVLAIEKLNNNVCWTISIRQIEMVQHRAARFVLGKPWRRCERDSITNMLNQLNWTTLEK